MALQIWLPLNKDTNVIPDITGFSKEGSVTLTADTDGWYKVSDSSHTSSRWGIYKDFTVKPNTKYTLYVYSKSTTGVTAGVAVGSMATTASWPSNVDTNATSTEKLKTYSWTTGSNHTIARIYLNISCTATVANNYVFFKDPAIYEEFSNQGLSNISTTVNGITSFVDNGKIGKGLYSNGSTFWTISPITLGTEASVALWVKTSDTNAMFWVLNASVFHSFNFWLNGNSYYLNTGDSSGNPFRKNGTNVTSLHDGLWHHYAITFDGTSCKLYIDGIYRGAASTYKSPATPSNSTIKIAGGYSNGHSYDTNGTFNDFRVYDHCLSPKEVKEISKGLVLHYKLDENRQTLDNCFNYPTFNTTNSAGGWSHWASSGSHGTYSQNTNKDYIYNKSRTYSHKVSCTDGNYYLCYQSPEYDGGYRSVQAIIKLEDSSVPDTSKIKWHWNANVGTQPQIKFISLGDGFYLMKCDGFQQSGSNDLVGIDVYAGTTVYISEAYLENDKQFCSNILFSNNNIITDVSGYEHHGALVGNITSDINSPRYNYCIKNTTEYLLNSVFDFPESNGITFACWVNFTAWGRQTSGIWATSSNSTSSPNDYNTTTCNHYDSRFAMRGTNGTTYNITCNTTDIPVNTWKHVVLTHDGTNAKLYINGTLTRTLSVPTSLVGFKSLFLGWSNAGGANRRCQGSWSDFRIYSTVLSAEDVLELYNTVANIDNKGNIFSYEFDENEINLFTLENWNLNAKTAVQWTTRNGEVAVQLNANNFYYGSGDARNMCFDGLFLPNTQYMFDMWIDYDDIVYNNVNRQGGISIVYTDDTVSYALRDVGDYTNHAGWKHKVFYSDPSKSIKCLSIYYWTTTGAFYRWDSVIVPVLYNIDINKNGILNGSVFNENSDIVQFHKSAVVSNSQLIEK